MKIFYDCEFIEDGRTIDLISIGMVAGDGREYYAIVHDDALISRAYEHPWLSQHVIPSLPVRRSGVGAFWDWDKEHPDFTAVRPRQEIAKEVGRFIVGDPADPEWLAKPPAVQLWAWYGAYDHVALCQLWGRMIDLPAGVPMWTNDLKQEAVRLGDPQVPEQAEGEHNALADARHNLLIARFLGLIP